MIIKSETVKNGSRDRYLTVTLTKDGDVYTVGTAFGSLSTESEKSALAVFAETVSGFASGAMSSVAI